MTIYLLFFVPCFSFKRNYSDTETEGEILNSLVQYFGDNLGLNVKAMPLVEETSLLEDSSVTLPVVVIGKFYCLLSLKITVMILTTFINVWLYVAQIHRIVLKSILRLPDNQ